jgi:flagellar protein FliS
MEKGGEISTNLRSLYNYMYKRLLDANMKKDLKIIDEVSEYIKDLRDTWIEAMKKEGSLAEKLPDPKRKRFDVAL